MLCLAIDAYNEYVELCCSLLICSCVFFPCAWRVWGVLCSCMLLCVLIVVRVCVGVGLLVVDVLCAVFVVCFSKSSNI